MSKFPSSFLWGGSSAAYQSEGAYLKDGKSLSIMDVLDYQGKADTKVCIDFYHRYKEDIALMKECGLKSFRFSISWPRILPKKNTINLKGIAFYNDLISELIKNNIVPIVTLYHFDLPLYLQEEYGGWIDRKIVEDFSFFARTCFTHFGNRVKFWITINEHNNCLYMPKFVGGIPNNMDVNKWRFIVNHHLALAHARSVALCHELLPNAKIGPAMGIEMTYPHSSKPEDILAAQNRRLLNEYMILDLNCKGAYPKLVLHHLQKNELFSEVSEEDQNVLKQGKADFIAVNYYQSMCVKESLSNSSQVEMQYNLDGKKGTKVYPNYPGLYQECDNELLVKTKWDWAIDPVGLRILLRDLYDRYDLPLMITENGLGAIDTLEENEVHDSYRIDYLKKHIQAISDAIADGVEMLSYNFWSFTDLLSTSNGFSKRYGIVYIDRDEKDLKQLERIRKDSFYWYQKVIKTNGENLD